MGKRQFTIIADCLNNRDICPQYDTLRDVMKDVLRFPSVIADFATYERTLSRRLEYSNRFVRTKNTILISRGLTRCVPKVMDTLNGTSFV